MSKKEYSSTGFPDWLTASKSNSAMRSLGAVVDGVRGVGPGFETVRLLLAITVLCWHSIIASYGLDVDQEAWRSPLACFSRPILPMFFALSGFLVMGSAFRTNNPLHFLALRGLRIFPALVVEVALCALILGPLLTQIPLIEYFSNRQTLAYFGNIIGRIRFTLPGVFETNPWPAVTNTTLWTIPLELLCYVLLASLMFTDFFKRKMAMLIFVVILAAACLLRDLQIHPQLMLGGTSSSHLLLTSFAFGALLYLWKDKVPFSAALFWGCLLLGLATVRYSGLTYFASLCFTYCVVYLGFTPLPKIPFLTKGDYSYGIYLYGFPIQQLTSSLFPGAREWYWNIVISLPLTICVAIASWWLVEKPALSLRKYLSPSKQLEGVRTEGSRVVLGIFLSAYACFLIYNSRGMLIAITPATILLIFIVVGSAFALALLKVEPRALFASHVDA